MNILILFEKTLSLAFWITMIFGFNSPYIAVLTIIAAIIHELGHLVVIRVILRRKNALLSSNISGFRIKTSGFSYKEEILASLSGPIANIIPAVIILLAFRGEYLRLFALLNLMTALSNLLPIEEYDGYKAVSALLSLLTNSPNAVDKFMSLASFSLSVVMCFLSLFLILKLGNGYWMFFIFFSLIIIKIKKRQKYTFYED